MAMQRIPVQNGKWMKILCIDWIHLLVGGFNSIENKKKSNWIIFPKIRGEDEKVFEVATNEFNRIQAPGISLDFWHNSCPSITPNTVTP